MGHMWQSSSIVLVVIQEFCDAGDVYISNSQKFPIGGRHVDLKITNSRCDI